MEQFTFDEDIKCTIWTRSKYVVEAESMEEAKRLFIQQYKANDICSDEHELLWETIEETSEQEFIDEQGDTFSIED